MPLLWKIVGDLFLENEEIKKILQHQRSKFTDTIDFYHRMLTLLNSLIEAMGMSRAASMRREGCLQNQRQELFDQLLTAQEEKEKLQKEHNTLQQDLAQCKQMYKQQSEEQSSTISALEREISLLKRRISGEYKM